MGKGRLAMSLTEEQRLRLGMAFAEHAAATAEQAGLLPLIVAGDDSVAEWSLFAGIPVIPDPGEGLSAAAEAGVSWANQAMSSWLVVHTDLPLLEPSDLILLNGVVQGTDWVIAPSSDGGTSAIGGSGEAKFAYGPGSFFKHIARFPRAKIVARLGLLHDVDTPGDLASARAHSRGEWLHGLEMKRL